MTQSDYTRIYNRTRLILNLQRSGKLQMSKEMKEEAQIVCFYLVRKYKSNGEVAKVETYRKYGVNESRIQTLIKKWEC